MKKILLTSALSVAMSTTVLAASTPWVQMPSKAGVVVGAEFGGAIIQTPTKKLYNTAEMANGSASVNRGSFAYGAHLGYDFALTQNVLLGPELGYYSNGLSQYKGSDAGVFSDKVKVRSNDIDLLAKLTYMFFNGWNVFGKAGVARVTQKFDAVTAFGTTLASAKKTEHQYKPELGIGVGYEFGSNIGFTVSYHHIFGTNSSNFRTKANRAKKVYAVDALMAAITYRFHV
jgi:opacity protein-like surface antigen